MNESYVHTCMVPKSLAVVNFDQLSVNIYDKYHHLPSIGMTKYKTVRGTMLVRGGLTRKEQQNMSLSFGVYISRMSPAPKWQTSVRKPQSLAAPFSRSHGR